MTVSSSVARRRTIGKVLVRAAQKAGILGAGQSLKQNDRELLRELLEDVVDDLSVDGVQARARTFYNLTLTSAQVTAETFKFDLPSTILAVVGDGKWIASDETDTERASTESLVRKVGLETWHRISNKAATASKPTMMYEHRETDTIQVWLWQIPSDAGTLRIPCERHLSDVDDDDATLDLQPYWYRTITSTLAADYREAKGLTPDERAIGEAKATSLRRRARTKAAPQDDLQISIRRR